MPGQTASFANVDTFSNGLNGIMIDISGLPSGASLSSSDFVFKFGNSSNTSTWSTATAPSTISVRTGAGTSGSDRVELVWSNNALTNAKWLQVEVLPDANTGLAGTDVFYFGQAIGDSATSNDGARVIVNANDELACRNNNTSSATITNIYDLNRDQVVDSNDELIARSYPENTFNGLFLNMITPGQDPYAQNVADYYDAAGRITAEENVGTNGGSAWTRPSSVDSRSDSHLVTTYAYDNAGNQNSVTDPREEQNRDRSKEQNRDRSNIDEIAM